MTVEGAGPGWVLWADRGGTFTDLIARDPGGGIHTAKLLSAAPGQYQDAVVEGARRLLGVPAGAPLPAGRLAELRLGTTVTTNALLEGRHAPCALLTNAGFEDLLWIGDQSRPELFALAIERPAPLCTWALGVAVRRDAQGRLVQPLDEDGARARLGALRAAGCEGLAIALLHATAEPADERALAALARDAGFAAPVCSHEVSAEIGLLERAQTAVVEAALAPVLQRYTAHLAAQLPGTRIRLMQSDGTLADAGRAAARSSIFSGPAGGVMGARGSAAALGIDRVIGFDMGGTSTDVFAAAGALAIRPAAEVAGQVVRAPTLDLHTVAAGGGSRVLFDGARLRVGPESAGADPGPACYGRGGPAAVTDANLLLGRLYPEGFAPVFGATGDRSLDRAAARAAFVALAGTGAGDDQALELARGAVRIALEHMAGAVRRISVARGLDPRGHCLVAFGGAGPQHACELAQLLDISRVLVPARASLLSAVGLGLAAAGVECQAPLVAELSAAALARAEALLAGLRAQAVAGLRAQGETPAEVDLLLRLHYANADTVLDLPLAPLAALREAFAREHEVRFGFADPERPVQIALVLARAQGRQGTAPAAAAARGVRVGEQLWMPLDGTAFQSIPVWDGVGARGVAGPALILLDQSSLLLPPGWRAQATVQGLLATRAATAAAVAAGGGVAELELANNRFMGIAVEMGETLRRGAHSVNVRNRLDYSCALFDAGGRLVANAPHIPVHLGSMGDSVRAILDRHGGDLCPGGAWLINDPYRGGTHLPDLTLVMPVYEPGGAGRRFAFVAARAHHADIGGRTPGSMPADSRSLAEEGLCFAGERIARDGRLDAEAVRALLARGPWPARNPQANLADLRAQLAACARGAGLLRALAEAQGIARIGTQMAALLDYTAGALERLLARLAPGAHRVVMDEGQRIQVRLEPGAGRLRIDFSGTSGMDPGNANAPLPVVRAAVMYALRCLIGEPLPLNEGFLTPIELRVPAPSLLDPRPPAAVVAGNVETSQAVADALLVALGALAESQGTMNNLSFGNARVQYYETLGGGAGAGPGCAGASGVHTHMTNSRITDAEVIERRFPVRIERFALRRGSGGAGRWRGGDGLLREIRFLEAMELALIGNRRRRGPRGQAGGGDGLPGVNTLVYPDGRSEALPGRWSGTLAAGSLVRIETPGGGGWGNAQEDPASAGPPPSPAAPAGG
ncbi:MAG: hydantoinase B/oxoprolinase family protein [Pseudomonadota bacterium]